MWFRASERSRAVAGEKAIDLWKRTLNPDNAQEARLLNQQMALADRNLSTAWNDQNEDAKAIEAGQEALRLDEALAKNDEKSPVRQLAMAFDLGTIGTSYASLGKYEEAEENWRRSVELREAVLASNPQDYQAADRVAYALRQLAQAEQHTKGRRNAHAHLVRAVELYERLTKKSALNRQSLYQYAVVCHLLGVLEREAKSAGDCVWFQRSEEIAREHDRRVGQSSNANVNEMIAQIHADAKACGSPGPRLQR